MSQDDCIYTFACGMFSAVFGVYYLDEICTSDVCHPPPDWYDLAETMFINWLYSEEFATECFKRITREKANHGLTEEISDKLINQSLEKIYEILDVKHKVYRLRKGSLLYYYFCGWTLSVLHEFEKIMEEIKVLHPNPYDSFRNIYDMFRKFEQLLKTELLSIDKREKVDSILADKLREDIETLSQELAKSWREVVYAEAARYAAR